MGRKKAVRLFVVFDPLGAQCVKTMSAWRVMGLRVPVCHCVVGSGLAFHGFGALLHPLLQSHSCTHVLLSQATENVCLEPAHGQKDGGAAVAASGPSH